MADRKFAMALLVNELAMDLLYFGERLDIDPDGKEELFKSGIAPRLAQASESLAALLEIPSKKPPARENGSTSDGDPCLETTRLR